ncbi:hypothetical protein BB559_007325, partial [Furculomyces boomerangus]
SFTLSKESNMTENDFSASYETNQPLNYFTTLDDEDSEVDSESDADMPLAALVYQSNRQSTQLKKSDSIEQNAVNSFPTNQSQQNSTDKNGESFQNSQALGEQSPVDIHDGLVITPMIAAAAAEMSDAIYIGRNESPTQQQFQYEQHNQIHPAHFDGAQMQGLNNQFFQMDQINRNSMAGFPGYQYGMPSQVVMGTDLSFTNPMFSGNNQMMAQYNGGYASGFGNYDGFDDSDGPLITVEHKGNPIERATGLVGAIASIEQVKNEQKYRDSSSIIRDRKMRRNMASAMGNYTQTNVPPVSFGNTYMDESNLAHPGFQGGRSQKSMYFSDGFNVTGNAFGPVNGLQGNPGLVQNPQINYGNRPISSYYGGAVGSPGAFAQNANIGYSHSVSNFYRNDNYNDDDDNIALSSITNADNNRSSMLRENIGTPSGFLNLSNSSPHLSNINHRNSNNGTFPRTSNGFGNSGPMHYSRSFDKFNRLSIASNGKFNSFVQNSFSQKPALSVNIYDPNYDTGSTKSSEFVSRDASPNNRSYEPSKLDPSFAIPLKESNYSPPSSYHNESKLVGMRSSHISGNSSSRLSNMWNANVLSQPLGNDPISNNSQNKSKIKNARSSILGMGPKGRRESGGLNDTKENNTKANNQKNLKLENSYDPDISYESALTFEQFIEKCTDSKPYSSVLHRDAYNAYLNFCVRNGTRVNDKVSSDTFERMMRSAEYQIKQNKLGDHAYYNLILI